jgi:hypothetical protein
MRNLDQFNADGPLAMKSVYDHGFMIQVAGFLVRSTSLTSTNLLFMVCSEVLILPLKTII